MKPNSNIYDHDVIMLDDKFKIESLAVDNSETKKVRLDSTKKLKSLDIKVTAKCSFLQTKF